MNDNYKKKLKVAFNLILFHIHLVNESRLIPYLKSLYLCLFPAAFLPKSCVVFDSQTLCALLKLALELRLLAELFALLTMNENVRHPAIESWGLLCLNRASEDVVAQIVGSVVALEIGCNFSYCYYKAGQMKDRNSKMRREESGKSGFFRLRFNTQADLCVGR